MVRAAQGLALAPDEGGEEASRHSRSNRWLTWIGGSIHLSSIAGCDTHKAERRLWSLAVRVGRFSCRVVAVRLLFEPPNFHRGLGAAGRDEQEKENVCHRGFLSRIAASDSEWARGDKVTRTRCCW